MIESKLFSLAKEKYDKKKADKVAGQQEDLIKDLGGNYNKKEDFNLLKKVVPEKITYVRSSRFESDLGTVKTKCMFNSTLEPKERFSYLGFLNVFRNHIENFTRLSSKAIRVDSLQVLIPKQSINADSYYIYKYCPSYENASCTSNRNLDPHEIHLGNNIEEIEYANMSFITHYSVDEESAFHYFGEKNFADFQYINGDNPYIKEMGDDYRINNSTDITKSSIKGNVGDQYLRLSLSSTDNDVLIMLFKGKVAEIIEQPLKIKVVINIEFTVEDYIQNVMSVDRNFSHVILREILMKRSIKAIQTYYLFAKQIKNINAANVFKQAIDVFDANKNIITMFSKWKSIYKSALSMASKGVTSSSSKKIYDIILSEKLFRQSAKKEFITKPSGIYAALLSQIDFKLFYEINSKIKEYKSLGEFLGDFVKTGSIQLYFGDDRTIPNNLLNRVKEIPKLLEENDPKQAFIRNKRMLKENKIEDEGVKKITLYNSVQGKLVKKDIEESEIKLQEKSQRLRNERKEKLEAEKRELLKYIESFNTEIALDQKRIEDTERSINVILGIIARKKNILNGLPQSADHAEDRQLMIKEIEDKNNEGMTLEAQKKELIKKYNEDLSKVNGARIQIDEKDKEIGLIQQELDQEMDLS